MDRKLYAIKIVTVIFILIILFLLIGGWNKEKKETFDVVFKDYNGEILREEIVSYGKKANAPKEPSRDGYTFSGWDKDFSAITKDIVIYAEYIRIIDTNFIVDTITVSTDVKTVKVKISVENNPGILGMTFSLNYNDEVLKLISCQNGEVLSSLSFQEPSQYVNGCNFVWYGSTIREVMDGEMLVLIFEVADNVKPGIYPVSVSWNERNIFDSNCDILDPEITQGAIIVSE